MDVERLLKKRQLNVQEQNALVAHRLRQIAKHWQEKSIPAALTRCGAHHGIDWTGTVILKLEIDFPGMPNLFGMLLTPAEQFITFEIETDDTHEHVVSLEKWKDVTAELDHSCHKRGTGKGFATLALEVRRGMLSGK